MEVTYRKTSELKEYPGNPRKIDQRQMDILMTSIRENPDYFFARPIILSDRTGELVIIAGNQRLKASKKIGLKEVPTVLLTGLTEQKEKEILLRDNHNNGEFDFDLLKDWDFDFGSIGLDFNFLEPEFEDLIGDYKNKPPVMKITFESPEQLQEAETEIQELLNRKYPKAFYSVSCGEI